MKTIEDLTNNGFKCVAKNVQQDINLESWANLEVWARFTGWSDVVQYYYVDVKNGMAICDLIVKSFGEINMFSEMAKSLSVDLLKREDGNEIVRKMEIWKAKNEF